jgi:hypothetical protein
MQRRKTGPAFWLVTALFALSAAFIGCGGGGGSSSGSSGTVISGTAAAGAAIIGTVTIKDSSSPAKMKSVTIAADGKYSIDVSGLTPPFALRADGDVGGRRYSLFSAATSTDINGTINITPLTDLILANIAGDIAANYYNGTNFSGITKEALDNQIATLTAQLMPILTSLGLDNSINLLRTSFNSDHTGMDAVMDVLKVSVDETTKIATILNVINNSSITQNIVTNSITGTLDGTGVAAGVTTLQQVVDTFTAFSNLYSTGLPTPAQVGAIGLFDNTNFLSNGQSYDEFITDVTTNAPVGLKFTNIAIVSTGTDSMVIHFTVMVGSRIDGDEEWMFKKDATTGKYLAWGNQRHLGAWLKTKAHYQPNAPPLQQIQTGLYLDLKDPHLFLSGNGVAILTGPGGVNETFVYDISNTYFRRLSDPYVGDLIPLNDSQIALIPDVNATYTINLYDNTAGAMILKETYTETIGKRPILNSALSVASFPTITNTPTTLVGFTGGTVSATWTLPAGLMSRYYAVGVNDDAGNNAYEEIHTLSAGDLSASVTFTPLGWTATHGWFGIGVDDIYGRELSTSMWN